MSEAQEAPKPSTLYSRKPPRRLGSGFSPLPLLAVVAWLLAAHALNVFMQWSLVRSELAQKPAYHNPEYTFIGFAPLRRKEIAAARLLPNAAPAGRIYAYFDLLHPVRFMVWNNGAAGDFFDLGPLLVALPGGTSRIDFMPGMVFRLRYDRITAAKNFGGSIFGAFWAGRLSRSNGSPARSDPSGSFVVKSPPGSPSLRTPFWVYFYLPLALIVLAMLLRGTAMAACFFYYAGMFFLFDFEKLFLAVPLAWLLRLLGLEPDGELLPVLAAGVALLFLAAAVYGLLRWRKEEMAPGSKWIVLFFILLPLALFF